MSIDSALILDVAQIPDVTEVVARIAAHGHRVEFPKDFEFARCDGGLWRDIVLDGEPAGFDYVLSPATECLNEGGNPLPIEKGDSVLWFGARGDASVKLVAHVQRAICELSGAHGWIDEELVAPEEMIADAGAIIEHWDTMMAQFAAERGTSRKAVAPTLAQQAGIQAKLAGIICILLGGWSIYAAFGSNLLMTVLGLVMFAAGVAVFFIRQRMA